MGMCCSIEKVKKVNGYIVNNSKKDIQYVVIVSFAKKKQQKEQQTSSGPSLTGGYSHKGGKHGGNTGLNWSGGGGTVQQTHAYEYKPSTHICQAGERKSAFLNNLVIGSSSFGWKFRGAEKWMAREGVVNSADDVCLLIDKNGKSRSLSKKQVQQWKNKPYEEDEQDQANNRQEEETPNKGKEVQKKKKVQSEETQPNNSNPQDANKKKAQEIQIGTSKKN